MKNKIALIMGITGQDGAYLAEHLIKRKYKVYGIVRRKKNTYSNLNRLNIRKNIILKKINTLNYSNTNKFLKLINPSEIYNLSGVSSVGYSFKNPKETYESIIVPTFNVLQSIYSLNLKTKFYNSCSSECFGNVNKGYSVENDKFSPISPYGYAKATSFEITKFYREKYNIFASSGIAYNHESPLRGKNFICKKIIRDAINIKKNKQVSFKVGNINIIRDWGWAPDFVKGYKKIIDYDIPDDFIICSKNLASLEDIIKYVFKKFNLDYKKYIEISQNNIRKNDILRSAGSNSKILKKLKWQHKFKLDQILDKMINSEIRKI